MTEIAMEQAAAQIGLVLQTLSDDDRSALIGRVVSKAIRDLSAQGKRAACIAALMEVQAVAILTVDHEGTVEVDSCSFEGAHDDVKLIADEASALLVDLVEGR